MSAAVHKRAAECLGAGRDGYLRGTQYDWGVRRGMASMLAGAALVASGCGSDPEPATPAACLDGAEAYVEALRAAPDEVALDGVPIGDCLTDEQSAGQIADVGEAMLATTKRLNDEAREGPLGDAPVRLGYLVGVVEARAEQTGGIHQDLALNVESAATFIPGDEVLPGGFQQRYEEGLAAGRESV